VSVQEGNSVELKKANELSYVSIEQFKALLDGKLMAFFLNKEINVLK